MKKKWMKRGSAAALAAVVCLNGCGMRAGQEMENGGYKSQTNVKEPEAIAFDDVEGRIARREENQVPESFLEAVRQFSWCSAALLLEETEENRNYSPLSLYYALALAAQGASGTTEQEFLDLLGVDNRDELAEACGKLYRLLYTDNEIGQLKLADSLWMSGKSKFKKTLYRRRRTTSIRTCSWWTLAMKRPEKPWRMDRGTHERHSGAADCHLRRGCAGGAEYSLSV